MSREALVTCLYLVYFYQVWFLPSRQKPSQSQRNNARAKAMPLLYRYFTDFKQVFAGGSFMFAYVLTN